jgi:hypothetical protein
MYFDVFIPTSTRDGLETRLQVQARDWRQATEASARHGGVEWNGFGGTFIEIRPNGERVITDQSTRTQYIIREIDKSDTRISQVLDAGEVKEKAEESGDKKKRTSSGQIKFRAQSGQHHTLTAPPVEEMEEEDSGRVLQETVEPSQPVELTEPVEETHEAVSESALEEAFLEIPAIFEPDVEMPDAIDFVLDLAKKYIPCSHAGILFTKETADALYFAAARGKGSKKMLETDVPMDSGLISRSLRNGAAFSVTDVVNDSRYDPTFTNTTGIKVDSLLCAPVQKGVRAFGVLALMNREGRDSFHQNDVNVAQYLGGQLGEYIQRQFDQQPLE